MAQVNHQYWNSVPKLFTLRTSPMHTRLQNDPNEWKALEVGIRTNLLIQFYLANLPPLSLKDANIAQDTLDRHTNFSKMTVNQLRWHTELALNCAQYSAQKVEELNQALITKTLPLVFEWGPTKFIAQVVTSESLSST